MFRLTTLVLSGVLVAMTGVAQAQEKAVAAPLAKKAATPMTGSAPVAAEAPESGAPVSRLSGTLPDTIPTVTLDLEDESIGDALSELVRQAGWSMAFSGSSAALEQEITLKIQSRPVTEALEVVLDAADLEARLNGGTLVVKGRKSDAAAGAGTLVLPMGDLQVKIKAGDGVDLNDHHLKVKHHGANKDDRVVVGSNGEVGVDEAVGDAVAVGGSMTVMGHVRGDAVAIGGNVVLEPSATVDGDAVAIGGEVDVADGASIKGDRVSIGGSLGGLISGLVDMGSRHSLLPGFVFGILSTLLRAIVLLVLGLLLIAFMPERIENVREFLTVRPGHSALAGFGVMVGFLPLCLLLVVTLVGIPLVPVAALMLAVVMVIGLTAFSVWLGYRIPLFKAAKTPVVAMLIGLGMCTLVDLVPVVGSPLLTFVAFASSGAVLLTRFGKNRLPRPTTLAVPTT
jgi:hypothetical protein